MKFLNIRSKNIIRVALPVVLILAAAVAALVWVHNVNAAPFRVLNGVVWFEKGPHFLSNAQVSERVEAIVAPNKAKIEESIAKSTLACAAVNEGFCLQGAKTYAYKSLVKPAVEYVPGTPDTEELVDYCTLCNDLTFSPTCAVGRGACSYHEGVASYDVARYRTIPGTPETPAQPAEYSYAPKSYFDSPNYIPPESPSLSVIVNFAR